MQAPSCLVVGASGFVGSHILKQLRNQGFSAVGTRANSADASLLHFDLKTDGIADCLNRANLGDGNPLVAVICSAMSRIDRCKREPEQTRFLNVEKTKLLIDDLAERQARVIFLSTSHVFDGQSGRYTEASPTNPLTEYGRQKLAIEEYLKTQPVSSLVLRLEKVIGNHPTEAHLLSELDALIQSQQPIRCLRGQILSPTVVDDVAHAVTLAIQNDLRGLYHVASPERFSRAELARLFFECANRGSEIREEPFEKFAFADCRPLDTTLDSTRFQKTTGLQFTPLRTVIETFLQRTAAADGPFPPT